MNPVKIVYFYHLILCVIIVAGMVVGVAFGGNAFGAVAGGLGMLIVPALIAYATRGYDRCRFD